MRWRELNGGTLRTFGLVFDKGDEVVTQLERFARDQSLHASSIRGLGAFDSVVLGFFDWDEKDYRRVPLHEQMEVLSLVGDFALGENGKQKLHAHVVIATADALAHGGHLLEGTVRPTLEVIVTETPTHLQRRRDPETGLALLRI